VPADAGRAQHLLAARWRCVELGVPMVRAVNTGISCAVDQSGSLIGPEVVDGLRRNVREDGALVAHVPLTDRATIFGRIGNVFAYAAMGVGWAVFAWAWVVGRKNRAISRRLT
jgi:apolipoprotein N-acyltransferase